MAKREILILSSWYPSEEHPFLGNFVVRHAQLLNTASNVTLVNTVPSDTLSQLKLTENTKLGYREIQVTHPRGNNLYSKKRWQKKALKLAFLEVGHIDLIIGHVLLPKALQFVVAKKNFNCPLILVEHGSYYRKGVRSTWNRFQEFKLKYTRKHFDEIVAVSEFLKKDIQRNFPSNKITVIGNHVDTNAFRIGDLPKDINTQFLHVSTLDPATKNPNGIIDACALLVQADGNFQMTIICDEDYSEWQQMAADKELNEHIHFEGPLDWHALIPFYQKADAFVLNSTYESFSIVLAEAWATGTPVISTSVGIAYELDPILGIETEQNNPESLKNAMHLLIQTKTNYDANQIRQKAMRYSGQSILEQWTNLINIHVK